MKELPGNQALTTTGASSLTGSHWKCVVLLMVLAAMYADKDCKDQNMQISVLIKEYILRDISQDSGLGISKAGGRQDSSSHSRVTTATVEPFAAQGGT